MIDIILSVSAVVLCFIITVLALRKLIPVLVSKKIGQKILEIGPRWHMDKSGTPTMGGLSFILSFTVSVIVFAVIGIFCERKIGLEVAGTALFAVLNGLIGVIDDRTKFSKNRNEGLKAWQKYLLQLILTAAYIAFLRLCGFCSTEMYIPFVGKTFELGFFWYIIMVLIVTGIINSVNLADGIDGLASSETAIVAIFFIVSAVITKNYGLGLVSSLMLGCSAGFLVYNIYPARVFMGDTGSLFLGALVVGCGVLMNNPVITLIVGIMYVAEAVSDILQVGYFKLTHGKRLFKMAPIHHHFEKCGWSENKIVTVFSAVTLAASVLALVFDVIL